MMRQTMFLNHQFLQPPTYTYDALPEDSGNCPTKPITAVGCPSLNSISSTCVNVKSIPPYSPPGKFTQGAIGDGVIDDTAVIQAHINALAGTDARLYFPPGTYLINAEDRLWLNNHMTLHLESGDPYLTDDDAILKAKPNSLKNFAVLAGKKISNVNIIDGIIVGERIDHKGTEVESEWGMGIEFYDAHNIVIQGTTSNENWGDGLYIGATDDGKNSGNINICNFTADHNRRQGSSVTGANGVMIKQSTFQNTGGFLNSNGTPPMSGIDVEPNLGESVDTVTIEDSIFINNDGSGISTGAIIRAKPKDPATGSATNAINMIRNTIQGNGINGGSAIFMSLAIGNKVDQNTISDNIGTGIYMEVPKANTLELNNQITNNKIYKNGGYGIEMYQVNKNTVKGNIVINNTSPNNIALQVYACGRNDITYNTIQGLLNESATPKGLANNIKNNTFCSTDCPVLGN